MFNFEYRGNLYYKYKFKVLFNTTLTQKVQNEI